MDADAQSIKMFTPRYCSPLCRLGNATAAASPVQGLRHGGVPSSIWAMMVLVTCSLISIFIGSSFAVQKRRHADAQRPFGFVRGLETSAEATPAHREGVIIGDGRCIDLGV